MADEKGLAFVEGMAKQIQESLWSAIRLAELVSYANDSDELRKRFDRTIEVHGLNVVSHALLCGLILEIARICDGWDKRRNNRASIPAILGHLDDLETFDQVVSKARTWFPDGTMAERDVQIASNALIESKNLFRGKKIASWSESIKDYRNRHLAHSLIGLDEPIDPLKYAYVFDLLENLKPIVKKLCLGVLGHEVDFDQISGSWSNYAEAFWSTMLNDMHNDKAPK